MVSTRTICRHLLLPSGQFGSDEIRPDFGLDIARPSFIRRSARRTLPCRRFFVLDAAIPREFWPTTPRT